MFAFLLSPTDMLLLNKTPPPHSHSSPYITIIHSYCVALWIGPHSTLCEEILLSIACLTLGGKVSSR